MPITLITGGARSGKSRFAEKLALEQPGRPVYIATAEALDDEMRARISEHKARRDDQWLDKPATIDLAGAIAATEGHGVRLIDCLTMWLSNLVFSEANIEQHSALLVDALSKAASPVVLVTNEIGSGIVPDNKLSRDFRDAQGRLNQLVGAAAEEIILVVCGHPVKVK